VEAAYTETQGQVKSSPPAIHQMMVTLDKRGFIERTPGVGRSIRLRLSRDQLPDLLGSQQHDELARAALQFRDGAEAGSRAGIQLQLIGYRFVVVLLCPRSPGCWLNSSGTR
jgi:hypothetical protein